MASPLITGHFFLDWALVAVSVFNAILLLWLSLTVFLNAERRTWGVWLVEEGLMMGALFFVSHTIILSDELTFFGVAELEFWWKVGWMPVVLAPYAWYVVILWFAGYWENSRTPLRRRHRFWFYLTSVVAAFQILLISFAHPLPSYEQLAQLDIAVKQALNGVPVMFMIYPPFVTVCILLPIDALLRPEPSQRMMGDLARRRSRPWLIAASVALLLVALLLTVFMAWVVNRAYEGHLATRSVTVVNTVAFFDLLLSALITAVIVLLGQAIVSYEIFTGKTLPRRGFFHHWRNANILAAGCAVLVSWLVVYRPLLPIYGLLLMSLLIVVFHVLSSWRSFANRDTMIKRLRPFVSSQGLMHQLITPEGSSESYAKELFHITCRDMLGTKQAYLIPMGILAPLIGSPMTYPETGQHDNLHLPLDQISDSSVIPLDGDKGFHWAIPLWAERGLIGVLLLGEKQDGGLYALEEIEIARASAERIVDMLAGEQMARRLMELQRRRQTETRVLDLRTRRILHDETLPNLHMAVLQLSSLPRDNPALQSAIKALMDVHAQISDLIHTASNTPLKGTDDSGLVDALQEMLNEEFAGAFQEVRWKANGSSPKLDPLVQEVVFHAVREAVRNAAVHGRGDQTHRPLNLAIEVQNADGLAIAVQDDGVGMNYQQATPGSRSGLALHSTMLAIIGGYLTVEPASSGGTRVVISLPAYASPTPK